MYRLSEYSKTQGILLITEIIHIPPTVEVPFLGKFARKVDPFMRISSIQLKQWNTTNENLIEEYREDLNPDF